MKQLNILLLLLSITTSSFSQQNLVPASYEVIGEAQGDLDKDGIEEKVVVYNISDKEVEIGGNPRDIIIFKKKNNEWTIWHRSADAVLGSGEGGMMGDPFQEITIEKGILNISMAGGSGWKWGHTDKYRFQNNQFELIGYESHYGRNCEYWTSISYNLSTGKIEMKKEYEKCDDDGENLVVYKEEKEAFVHKLKSKITLSNRNKQDLKIVTPKYKEAFYM